MKWRARRGVYKIHFFEFLDVGGVFNPDRSRRGSRREYRKGRVISAENDLIFRHAFQLPEVFRRGRFFVPAFPGVKLSVVFRVVVLKIILKWRDKRGVYKIRFFKFLDVGGVFNPDRSRRGSRRSPGRA